LSPGLVSEEHFRLLIDISSVRSERVINALKAYFVDGKIRRKICEEFKLSASYLSVKIREIQCLCSRVIDLYPYFC
ncbi:TPA: PapB/FocB family fimbrial expression transcriptional regulator, partial [Salmonella enterica subsp. enterica serovar Wandsworth]